MEAQSSEGEEGLRLTLPARLSPNGNNYPRSKVQIRDDLAKEPNPTATSVSSGHGAQGHTLLGSSVSRAGRRQSTHGVRETGVSPHAAAITQLMESGKTVL